MILSLSAVVTAQSERNSKNRDEAVAIGIRGGAALPWFDYPGNPELNGLGFDTPINRMRPVVGINVEIPLLGGWLYVAPEIDLVGRGDSRVFHSDLWDADVRYQVRVNYLEARLPVSVAFPVSSWLKPYVFAAPSFGLALPALMESGPLASGITQASIDTALFADTVAIGASNMAPYDFGVMAGAGLRFTFTFSRFSLVLKVEAGYHLGFKDTYSEAEHNDQAPALNVNAYNIQGKRQNRGLEAAVTLALPLRFAPGDACSHWSKGVYPTSRNHRHGF